MEGVEIRVILKYKIKLSIETGAKAIEYSTEAITTKGNALEIITAMARQLLLQIEGAYTPELFNTIISDEEMKQGLDRQFLGAQYHCPKEAVGLRIYKDT